jgi:uncharacterized SAM-binding protein YcdF (DUF218 family)/glycosyltransferase involved in cell wall biosynthesis
MGGVTLQPLRAGTDVQDSHRLEHTDVLCLSSIDWDFNWQGHQEVMTALAAQGNRVLFLENTGVRAPRLSDAQRLRRRLLNWWRGTKGFRQERENLVVYSPLVLPFPHSRLARWVNRAMLVRSLRRWSRATGFDRPIIWTFLPTRLVVDLIDRLDPEAVVYYCIADFEQLTSQPRAMAKSERMLLNRADVVFVQGEELRQRCLPHPNIHIFPFGVDTSIFSQQVDVAPEISGLKRPLIGYVGGIHRHVDFEVLERVGREIDGTLVLVGPVQADTDVDALRQLPNVVFAGPQPHSRIPAFVKGFDVGLIPYTSTEYTRTVYPTKMNEYLAVGIPVVATDLPEIRTFSEANGNIVEIASTPDAFIDAVREAVATRSIAETQRRVSVAREHGWEGRIARMSALVADARGRRLAARDRWEERLLRTYRHARWRMLQVAVGTVAIFALLFYTPLAWAAARPLYVTEPASPADAIVVFGGGVGESGVAGGGYQERVASAVDLYREGYSRNIVFVSGFIWSFPEAEVMKSVAVAQGVPADAILLGTKPGNTYEYVAFVERLMETQRWQRILLVSSPYHMRRALMTFQAQAPGITVVAAPVVTSQFYAPRGYGASFEQIRGILHEYAAIAVYWWRGWL